MTAAELIALLAELPPETKIFVWDDERRSISDENPLDHWQTSPSIADINIGFSISTPFDPISSGKDNI
jgi:hypothetical protein